MRIKIVLLFFLINTVVYSQESLSANEFFIIQDSLEQRVILDVRIFEKYKKDRIPEAFYAGEKSILKDLLSEYNYDITLLVYCEYGERSKSVIQLLRKDGFTNLYHLKKGFRDWKRKGFPVDNEKID